MIIFKKFDTLFLLTFILSTTATEFCFTMALNANPNHIALNIPAENNPQEKKEPRCFMMSAYISLVSIALGIIAGGIAYYYYAISGLVTEKHYLKDCPHNDVWACVLTSLIVFAFVSNLQNKLKADDEELNKGLKKIGASIQIVASAAMLSWCVVEFTSNGCDGLKKSVIWSVLVANIALNSVSLAGHLIWMCFL